MESRLKGMESLIRGMASRFHLFNRKFLIKLSFLPSNKGFMKLSLRSPFPEVL
jgi:hypothetical protein